MRITITEHCARYGSYVVSEGTLQPRDIIPKMLDCLAQVAPAAYQQAQIPGVGFPMVPSYALEDSESEWWDSEAASDACAVLGETLSEHAPEGFYFGINEGDGACFGFWRGSV